MYILRTMSGKKKLTEQEVRLMRAASHAIEGPERKRFMLDPVISMWFLTGLFIGIVIGLIF